MARNGILFGNKSISKVQLQSNLFKIDQYSHINLSICTILYEKTKQNLLLIVQKEYYNQICLQSINIHILISQCVQFYLKKKKQNLLLTVQKVFKLHQILSFKNCEQ